LFSDRFLRQEKKLPVFLTNEEIQKMFEVTKSENDLKSELMIRFALNTGCRPSEVVKARVKHLNFENGFYLVTKTKSKKERTAYISDSQLLEDLKKYIHDKKTGRLILESEVTLVSLNQDFKPVAIPDNIKSRLTADEKRGH